MTLVHWASGLLGAMAPRARRWATVFLVSVTACSKSQELVVHTGQLTALTNEQIDRDPIALLPGRAVALGHLDARQLFVSQIGTELLGLWHGRAPIPPSAGFDPRRDVESIHLGIYSMQGADYVAVVRGRFVPSALEQAARTQPRSPSGASLTEVRYAGRQLFVAEDIGFVVLTPSTLLLGNETGLRRTLDRIREGRVKREVPRWYLAQLANGGAPVVLGADLRAHPVPDGLSQELAFVQGLTTLALVGNFQPPGVNFAGTLGYRDADAANRGAANLGVAYRNISSYAFVMSLFGIAQPLRKLEAAANGRDLEVVLEVDARALGQLIAYGERWLATRSSQRGARR